MLASIARQKKTFASNNLLLLNKTRIICEIEFYHLLIIEIDTNNDKRDNNNNTSVSISMKTNCETFLDANYILQKCYHNL